MGHFILSIVEHSIIVVCVLVLFFYMMTGTNAPTGVDESVNWHRTHGKYRVLYNDGHKSQPFTYQVARDYAEIFGGKVIPR